MKKADLRFFLGWLFNLRHGGDRWDVKIGQLPAEGISLRRLFSDLLSQTPDLGCQSTHPTKMGKTSPKRNTLFGGREHCATIVA